ncbi:DDE-type integrase/transposase/recombinase [Neobacillus sp. OS1-2]|uniref:DDE-type integrase/transposase/recombinase n=1 Tax=Neobacillus sp. OS1-2 TaxID=3070680 RepID=UPI0027DEBEA7|nr:DDE-type integrase/transposase/recombinase [Neobacillus sp. OS1-2]WML42000.1 DDE-type integrase/transposase/recombinase [Neobacillus sp. OS1-2]
MNIFVNSIIEYRDKDLRMISIERVLWISDDLETAVVIRIDGKEKSPLPQFKRYHEIIEILTTPFAFKLEVDPYTDLNSPNEEYLDKHKYIRDEKWNLIKDYVDYEPYIYDIPRLEEIVKEIKNKTGKKSKRIYSVLREYWIGGKTKNSLLPNYSKSGGKGKSKKLKGNKVGRPPKKSILLGQEGIGVNVLKADKKIFEIAIKQFYKGKKTTLKEAYKETRAHYYISGYKKIDGELVPTLLPDEVVPTYRQFLYWYKTTYTFKDRLINRIGERQYQLTGRPTIGSSKNKAAGPGDIFEIDATIADIYLVSEIDRSRIIGRPVVYIVKDAFSRLIVGVYVGLEGPSWLAAMMALENTTVNKKMYCKRLEIDIEEDDWPSSHLPKKIKADRGEFESTNADKLTDSFGTKIINTPPYRADLKGIVERHFRILNDRIKLHWVPGIVHKDFKVRGGKDYRLDAKLTLKAFEKIIVLTILEHNHSIINNYPLEKEMISANIIPTPLNIWNWGYKHRSGVLKQVTRDEIRLNLMPSGKASVTGEGIIFNQMRYSSDKAINEGWFEKARKRRWAEFIQFDPRDVNHIYIGKEKFNLMDRDKAYSGFRLEEVLEQQLVLETQIQVMGTAQSQLKVDTDARIKKIINEETSSSNESQTGFESKLERLKEIKQNRKDEKIHIREQEKWADTLEDKNENHQSSVVYLEDFKSKTEEIQDESDHLLNLIINQDKEGEL